jgi:hypothetical protein
MVFATRPAEEPIYCLCCTRVIASELRAKIQTRLKKIESVKSET